MKKLKKLFKKYFKKFKKQVYSANNKRAVLGFCLGMEVAALVILVLADIQLRQEIDMAENVVMERSVAAQSNYLHSDIIRANHVR